MSVKKQLGKLSYGVCLCAITLWAPFGMTAETTEQNKPNAIKSPPPLITPLHKKLTLPTTPLTQTVPAPAVQATTVKAATTPATETNAPKTIQAPSAIKKESHIWNLQDADIRSVIDEISRETGKTFLIDEKVTGKVNLIATQPLSPDELYPVFLAILDSAGFSAVPSGDVIKIVPNADALQLGPAVASSKHPGDGDQLITRVIKMQYVSATQLIPVLRPMLPQWASITSYQPTNSLILVGSAQALSHIAQIVARIDLESNGGVDVVPLQNGNAKQIAEILTQLQSSVEARGGSSDQVSIVSDTRTNSIVLSGSEDLRLRTRVLISQLDNPLEDSGGGGGTQVIFLHYLNAKTIAPTLDKVAKGESALQVAGKGTTKAPTPGSTGQQPATSEGQGEDANLTAVFPEEGTNSLIITAPSAMMTSLKSIIQQLDVRPAEVYVQAVIVELDASSTEQLGIQWGTVNNAAESGTSGDPFQGGQGVAVVGGGKFNELISAIRGLSGANILSQPTIMVLDNKKATFSVGKQISIQDGSLSGAPTNGSSLPVVSSTYKQQNVGLSLDVQPQVDQDNTVQLNIQQKNDSLQNPDNPTTTPIINTSEIKTSVIINSGDVLILGGLMSNEYTTSTYETPILSDIPLIGRIFTYHQKELQKKNLMVFIRPVIIHSPLVGNQVTRQQYDYMRDLQIQWTSDSARKDIPDSRLLPPRGEQLTLPKPFE